MKNAGVVIFALLALVTCKSPEPQGDYDYLLSQDRDIIAPPSGTTQGWITIIGGNHTGQYYVAPDGSNSNPGTAAAPFQTISYAVTHLQPGDQCLLLY
jgi:hypothetical protein